MRLSLPSLAVSALLFNNAIAAAVSAHDAISGATVAHTATSSATAPAAATPSVSTGGSKNTNTGGTVDVQSRLTSLGFKNVGQNAVTNNGACWIGSDGPNTNVVKNGAGEPIVVVVWGPMGSWMTDPGKSPLITVGLAAGQTTTISCGDISGGMAAVYGNTKLSPYGQIDQTWVEFTFGQWGTVDVSREVNMSGNSVSVVGDKCTTDMSTCVFTCISGNTCMELGSYKLNNCGPSNGGQSDAAGANGGCFMGPGAKLATTFS